MRSLARVCKSYLLKATENLLRNTRFAKPHEHYPMDYLPVFTGKAGTGANFTGCSFNSCNTTSTALLSWASIPLYCSAGSFNCMYQ